MLQVCWASVTALRHAKRAIERIAIVVDVQSARESAEYHHVRLTPFGGCTARTKAEQHRCVTRSTRHRAVAVLCSGCAVWFILVVSRCRGVLGCCPTERQGPDAGARMSESSGARGRTGLCLDALLAQRNRAP